MRTVYDQETDTLTIRLNDAAIVDSDEESPGVIMDYDEAGNVISIEILDASRRVSQPAHMDFHVAFPSSSATSTT